MILLWSMDVNIAYASGLDASIGMQPTQELLAQLSCHSGEKHVIKPTVFPDKTTQVWKLPDVFKDYTAYIIDWRFEEERELFDIANLMYLLKQKTFSSRFHLHVPYLPYARQDKHISNTTTFALKPFLGFLSTLRFNSITTVDVHNEDAFVGGMLAASMYRASMYRGVCPTKVINLSVEPIHRSLIDHLGFDLIVFPDEGAAKRYTLKDISIPKASCKKKRDQETGAILGHEILGEVNLQPNSKVLLIDDLCDGGATFISVAKALRAIEPNIKIHLFTTHGIYSKGRKHLLDNGINYLYCTNSFGLGEFRV